MVSNQLKRQGEEIARLRETLEITKVKENSLKCTLKNAERQYADLESKMKENLVMARIRDAENTQCLAELTQKISSLEYKVS